MPNTLCVCGHAHDAHEHYRRGTDCATCGAEVCPKFRRAILPRKRPPARPSNPTTETDQHDDAPHRTALIATGPLAIVTDLRAHIARGLTAG